jgi:hypothetical protein
MSSTMERIITVIDCKPYHLYIELLWKLIIRIDAYGMKFDGDTQIHRERESDIRRYISRQKNRYCTLVDKLLIMLVLYYLYDVSMKV